LTKILKARGRTEKYKHAGRFSPVSRHNASRVDLDKIDEACLCQNKKNYDLYLTFAFGMFFCFGLFGET
jgi:hypothetical protein